MVLPGVTPDNVSTTGVFHCKDPVPVASPCYDSTHETPISNLSEVPNPEVLTNWLRVNPGADFGHGVAEEMGFQAADAGLMDLGSCAQADSAFDIGGLWSADLYSSSTTPFPDSDAGPSWPRSGVC
jgi:hypothetical protein